MGFRCAFTNRKNPVKTFKEINTRVLLNPFGLESSTMNIVLYQIIALEITKAKFYIATPCANLISNLNMALIILTKVQ